ALIKADQPAWLEMKHLGKKPLEKAVTLFDLAYQLASEAQAKAEYLVAKAYTYHDLPHPTLEERQEALKKLRDYARSAIDIDPKYAGGYGLKGVALVYESRELLDIGKKLELLRKADEELKVGLKLRDKLGKEKAKQLSLLLYPSLGSVCLELGNYEPELSDKAKYLARGKAYLEELLKQDDRNLQAWNDLGLMLEDMGKFIGKPAENYARACEVIEKAMDPQSLWAGRFKPWLDRGRVRTRWAALGGKDADKLVQ